MTINERLEALMNSLDMNARQFSETIGVKEGTTRNYIGRGSKPSAEYLEKIYNSIENINADWLLSGEGEKFRTAQTTGDNSPAAGRDSYNNSGPVSGGQSQVGHGGSQTSYSPPPMDLNLVTSLEEKVLWLEKLLAEKDERIQELKETIAHLRSKS